MRSLLMGVVAILALSAETALGTLIVTIPNVELLPNTAGQEVVIRVSGTDVVTNFNFRAVINDGASGPVFNGTVNGLGQNPGTDYLLNGSIWNTNTTIGETGEAPVFNPTPPGTAFPHFANTGIAFANNPGGAPFSVVGNGVLLTAIIDTTGVFSGQFPMTAGNHTVTEISPGVPLNPSNFSNNGNAVDTTFVNGLLCVGAPCAVPEPSPVLFGFLALGMVSCYRRWQSRIGI